MNLFTTLKRRIVRRLAKNSMVQTEAAKQLLEQPELLKKAGASPDLFSVVLEGAAEREKSLVRIVDHPVVIARIMNSPKIFTKMLQAVADNPEVLFRFLEKREVIGVLSAQNKFLNAVASDRRLRAKILRSVPWNERSDAILKLVDEDVDVLNSLTQTPETLAAALVLHADPDASSSSVHTEAEKVIADAMLGFLQDKAPTVLATVLENEPSLFEHAGLRDQAMRTIAVCPDRLEQVLALSTVMPSNGTNANERVDNLLTLVFDQPIVRQMLVNDEALRSKLWTILKDTSAAAGTLMENPGSSAASKVQKKG